MDIAMQCIAQTQSVK